MGLTHQEIAATIEEELNSMRHLAKNIPITIRKRCVISGAIKDYCGYGYENVDVSHIVLGAISRMEKLYNEIISEVEA